MAVREAVVAVIKTVKNKYKKTGRTFKILIVLVGANYLLPANAAVLPDERVDILQHQYEGGGVKV